MADHSKSTQELATENAALKERIRELEARETSIRQTKAELERSKERYQAVVEVIPDIIIQTNAAGEYLDVLAGDASQLFRPAEELLGATVSDILPTNAATLIIRGINRALHTGRPQTVEYQLTVPAGSLHFEARLIPSAAETVTALIRDVTERKRAEERYRSLTEAMNDILWTTDLELNITYLSPSVEKILGFTVDERMKQSVQEHMTSTSVKNALDRMAEELAFDGERDPERHIILDLDYFHKDGSVRCLETTLSFIRDNSGKPVGIHGLSRDITDHKLTQEELRKEEAFKSTVMDHLPIGIAVNSVEPDVEFSYMNDNFPKIYRTTREALLQPGAFWNVVYEDPVFREKIKQRVTDDAASGNPDRMYWEDVPFTRNGDGPFFICAQNIPIHGTEVMISTVLDVTDRKRAEKALQESEERYRDVALSTAGVIWETDTQFTITLLSGRVYETLGYEPGELIGRDPLFLIDPADRERVGAIMTRLLQVQEPVRDIDYWCRDRDGRRVRIQSSALPFFDDDGGLLGFRGTHLDITETYWMNWRKDLLLRIQGMSGDRDRAVSALLCEACAELTDSPMAFFGLVEPDLSAMIAHVWSPQALAECGVSEKPMRFPLENAGLWADPVRLGKPVIVNNYVSAPNKGGLPDGHVPLSRYIGVPVIEGGKVIAVAAAANRTADYDDRDVERLLHTVSFVAEFLSLRQKDRALQESEEKHRRLFETMAQGVIYQAADGTIISANPAAERILGLSFDQMRGKTSKDPHWGMIREDGSDVPGTDHPAMIALRTGKVVGPVIRGVFHPDRSTPVWLSITAIPLFQPGETEPFQAYATFEDITDRKTAEEELRRRENLLERIFEVLPVGLWFTDGTGRLIRGNPAGVKIWGGEPLVPPSEYGVFKARRLPSGEEIEADDWALAHTIRKGVTIVDELLEIDCFDGVKRTILNSTAPVFDEQGTLEAAIVVNQDITEREKLHAQFLQAQKMESVGRLAGGVAHDFNNMLGVILGHTEMLLDETDQQHPAWQQLTQIQAAAKRSAELTQQLLAFARKQTVTPAVLDLNEAIEDMHGMLKRLIGENIDLQWRPGPDLWTVRIDPSQVHQVLANLCVNARDAIDGVGVISIGTGTVSLNEDACAELTPDCEPGEYVMLSVKDDGCGMDKSVLDNMYDPFFTTKSRDKGTGLGLPMVYGIVAQNKGFIDVSSAPGRGTTVRIFLPRHTSTKKERLKKGTATAAARGSETILLVEDEAALLDLAAEMLEKQGYQVLKAETPGEAIRVAREHAGAIDLLLTDVIMPEMNGRELAERLQSLYPAMKRLFMSGYTADNIAHHGVLDEEVHFLQKPFTVDTLARKVREALAGDRRWVRSV